MNLLFISHSWFLIPGFFVLEAAVVVVVAVAGLGEKKRGRCVFNKNLAASVAATSEDEEKVTVAAFAAGRPLRYRKEKRFRNV